MKHRKPTLSAAIAARIAFGAQAQDADKEQSTELRSTRRRPGSGRQDFIGNGGNTNLRPYEAGHYDLSRLPASSSDEVRAGGVPAGQEETP